MPVLSRKDNLEFYEEAEKSLTPISPNGWRKSREHGFYVDMETAGSEKDMRILIDGTYVRDVTLAIELWEEVDKYSKPLTDLPKVFDINSRTYLSVNENGGEKIK